MAAAIIPVIQGSGKPVVVALLGSHLIQDASEAFAKARIPTFPFPERAASALSALSLRAEFTRADIARTPERPFTPIIRAATRTEDLLAAYGIQVVSSRAARTADEAASRARELGFPVVMKIDSPDFTHKSDVGGVLLDIADEDQVRRGYTQLVESVRAARPEAVIRDAMCDVGMYSPDFL